MSKPITIIDANDSTARQSLIELWSFRELISILALRDIKVRYKQTALGVAWAVIQPVFMMAIFTLLFGRLAKIPSDGIPYPVFVFSGLVVWNFFSASISSCANSLVGSQAMISKVYFPRIIIPLATIGVGFVDFMIASMVLLIIMAIYGLVPQVALILLPIFALGIFISVLGIGLWLAAITVTYRDFRFVVPFMLQLWMYVTPVIYPVSFIPQDYRWLMYLNPVTGWVSGVRSVFLGTPIDWLACTSSLVISLILLLIGVRYFVKAEKRFADVI